jgi:hypothetical protein
MALASCTSTQTASNLEYPLNNIYSSIEKVMTMGIQKTSYNHREFESRPFVVKQDPTVKKQVYHDRGIATVVVLGDGRPYNVEVTVEIQRGKISASKTDLATEYSHDHYDKILAKKLLDKILAVLDRRQHDDNIIDDFRPF